MRNHPISMFISIPASTKRNNESYINTNKLNWKLVHLSNKKHLQRTNRIKSQWKCYSKRGTRYYGMSSKYWIGICSVSSVTSVEREKEAEYCADKYNVLHKRWKWLPLEGTQIENTLISMSIRHRSDTKASDRYSIDGDPMTFATCGTKFWWQ